MSMIVQAVVGVAVLFFGRQLFWLFVGAVGFFVAISWVSPLLEGRSEWEALAIALVIGAAGAVLALVLERLAVAIAGFFAGGEITGRFLTASGFTSEPLFWVIVLVGAVAAAVLVWVLLDWALIVLSSVVGASLVAGAVGAGMVDPQIMFLLLAGVGILVQARRFLATRPLV